MHNRMSMPEAIARSMANKAKATCPDGNEIIVQMMGSDISIAYHLWVISPQGDMREMDISYMHEYKIGGLYGVDYAERRWLPMEFSDPDAKPTYLKPIWESGFAVQGTTIAWDCFKCGNPMEADTAGRELLSTGLNCTQCGKSYIVHWSHVTYLEHEEEERASISGRDD